MARAVLLPSETEEWGSPPDLFEFLQWMFGFTIDLAASEENALLPRYYSLSDSALLHDWAGERAWCNPPYDYRNLTAFTQKAYETWVRDGSPGFGMFLLPCKTDQEWFHKYVWPHSGDGVEIFFLRGRQKYQRPGKKAGAGFPSMLVRFGGCP